jgi:hypothetical protein
MKAALKNAAPYTSVTRPALGSLPSVALSSVRVNIKKHTKRQNAKTIYHIISLLWLIKGLDKQKKMRQEKGM